MTSMPLLLSFISILSFDAQELPDITTVACDLSSPAVSEGTPGPGKRVKQWLPAYESTDVHHLLYLSEDWTPSKRYPVIFEYPGNGPFKNEFGDTCTGTIDSCNLGYGLSAGHGYILVCLPFVSQDHKHNELQWWGDIDATVDYCKQTVRQVCQQYGGDSSALILAGFSRGAIACNYIGLHDDEIAGLWRGFIAHSHYDGVRTWPYPDSDRASAMKRLKRLGGRPQWISHEGSVSETQAFLEQAGTKAPLTFLTLPYRNHTNSWVLRNIPERATARKWLASLLSQSS